MSGVEVRVAAQRARDHRNRCGCVRASSGVELPGPRSRRPIRLWSRVSCWSFALVQQVRARVATWAMTSRSPSSMAAVMVVPIPWRPAPFARCLDDGAVRLLDGAARRFPVRMFGGKFGQHAHGYLGTPLRLRRGRQCRRRRQNRGGVTTRLSLVVIAKAADVGAAAERE